MYKKTRKQKLSDILTFILECPLSWFKNIYVYVLFFILIFLIGVFFIISILTYPIYYLGINGDMRFQAYTMTILEKMYIEKFRIYYTKLNKSAQ